MPAKGTYCDMCSKRGKKSEMIISNGNYFCSEYCKDWYEKTYVDKDEKEK